MLIALVLAASIFKFHPSMPGHILLNKTTFFHRILVFRGEAFEDGDFITTINLDNATGGAQYNGSRQSVLPYNKYWRLVEVYCHGVDMALFLGGGGFFMPEALSSAYPHARVEVSEIDPQVIEAGKKFFRTGEYPGMSVAAADARYYLKSSPAQYDLIFGDVFNGIHNVPFHLVTKEFFSLVKDRLTPDGAYMMNIISALQGRKAGFLGSVIATLREVFDRVDVYATQRQEPGALQNIIIVATLRKDLPPADGSLSQAHDRELQELIATRVRPDEYSISASPVFSDSYNPVEYVVARSF
jgi:spermidine synthase